MQYVNYKNVHLVGIKGVGMTALAQILKARGFNIIGSDTEEKFFTDEVLKKLGIKVYKKFSQKNIATNCDLVIYSRAYSKENNAEIKEAIKRKLPLFSYPEALSELLNNSYGIAVCGSHGKSTTTAMIGYILEYAGFDPTVVVGSRVIQWGANARVGKSQYFVIEADEYKDTFLNYKPKMIVLTNIEYDHPDYFKSEKSYFKSFDKFIKRVSSSNLIKLNKNFKEKFELKLPGKHNQENAYLAYRVALKLGVKPNTAKEAISSFRGLARRFEFHGIYNEAKLFDDYAHHPTEIKALLSSTRELNYSKEIIALFQPHTFSRTEKLFRNFLTSFDNADKVYILKTYSSAREKGEDVSGKKLAKSLNTKYFYNHASAVKYFKKNLNSNHIFLTIGAGDGWQVLKQLRKK